VHETATNQFVNEDEHLGLGVLGRLDVSVDGNAPSLVSNDLHIAVQTIDHGGEFRAENENVYSAELRKGVQGIRDLLEENASLGIHDEAVLDVDGCATLFVQFSI
jgi:hypothetical protein